MFQPKLWQSHDEFRTLVTTLGCKLVIIHKLVYRSSLLYSLCVPLSLPKYCDRHYPDSDARWRWNSDNNRVSIFLLPYTSYYFNNMKAKSSKFVNEKLRILANS